MNYFRYKLLKKLLDKTDLDDRLLRFLKSKGEVVFDKVIDKIIEEIKEVHLKDLKINIGLVSFIYNELETELRKKSIMMRLEQLKKLKLKDRKDVHTLIEFLEPDIVILNLSFANVGVEINLDLERDL